jgi:predicted ATPase
MYQYDQKPGTHIADGSAEAIQQIRESEYSVLVGRNNCGKSFLLKTLTQQWGSNASYLGPARYQNFNLLGYYTPNRNRKDEKWRNFITQWNQHQQNIDNSPMNLQQAIAELSDDQRSSLSEIVKALLGVDLDIRLTVETNSMSQKYISCGGHNISYTSSGFRLITTLVTSLLDTDYDTFLIDEPELGISPEAQGVLSDFLFDRDHRSRFFKHIRTLIFATHSTIFLDRQCISNNYQVEKSGDESEIVRVENQSDFNRIHFFLLGNRFETLYLPSSILLVEGKCDHKFIERVVAVKYPTSQLSVVAAHSDNRIKEVLSIAKGLLTDIQRSPYRDRIFVVLDSVHSASLPDQIAAMGVPKENIVIWPKNGIEYYYPSQVLDQIFGTGPEITIQGDIVSRNGVSYTKNQLVDRVITGLQKETPMNSQFHTMLLDPVQRTLGVS